jgi:hypothetical protein
LRPDRAANHDAGRRGGRRLKLGSNRKRALLLVNYGTWIMHSA